MFGQENIEVITVFNTLGEIVFSDDNRESFIDFCEDVPKGYEIKRRKLRSATNPYSGRRYSFSEYIMRPKEASE